MNSVIELLVFIVSECAVIAVGGCTYMWAGLKLPALLPLLTSNLYIQGVVGIFLVLLGGFLLMGSLVIPFWITNHVDDK